MWLYNLVMIFFNTVFLYFLLKTVSETNEIGIKKVSAFILIASSLIGISYNLLYTKTSLTSLISIIIYIVSSKIILENNIYKSILGVGLFYMLSGIGELICFYILVTKIGYSAENIRMTLILNFYVQLVVYIIVLFVIIWIRLYKKKYSNNDNSAVTTKRHIMTFMGVVLILMISDLVFLKYTSLDDILIVPINIVFMSIFLVISIIYITIMQTIIKKSEENEELKRDIIMIEELTHELRKFKHNYLNVLYGFSGYIENKEWDKLKDYYYEILKDNHKINNSVFSMQKIKNGALFGLFSQKYQKAKEAEITLELNAINEIKNIYMRNSDMCKVLGVYLDNAIEAATESKKKIVTLDIFEEKEYTQFIIKNSYNEEPDLKSLFKQGYTTKSGENRGIGLYSVKQILEQYENILYNTYIENERFVQEIIINKRD